MRFVRYLGRSFVKMYYDIFNIIIVNLLWVLLSLPIVTAPGAMAGLFYATNKLAKNEVINSKIFFDGFRKFFWISWRWTLLNMTVFLAIYLNYDHYLNSDSPNAKWLIGIVIGFGMIWIILQLFIFPLLIEQSENTLLDAVRSSILLFLRYPGPAYLTTLLVAAFALVSVWLFGVPWIIFLGGMCAYLITTTLMYVLGKTQYVDPTVS